MKILRKSTTKRITGIFLAFVMMAGLCSSAFSLDEVVPVPEIENIIMDGTNIVYVDSDGNEKSVGVINDFNYDESDYPATYAAELPGLENTQITNNYLSPGSSFDLRDYDGNNYVTAPERQGYGDCWTYATMSSLESNVMMQGYDEEHFSKSHLCYYTFHPVNEGYLDDDCYDHGGNYIYACTTLGNLKGIALESDYPNATSSSTPAFTENDRYNRGSGYILDESQTLSTTTDIKEWLMENGAVQSAMYSLSNIKFSDKNSTYNAFMLYTTQGGENTNHAITIIGWDDTVPASVFSMWGETPEHDGAWIIKNSWLGSDYDYMYLSYDQYLGEANGYKAQKDPGIINNYTYSESITTASFSMTSATYGNVYTASNYENVSQVQFWLSTDNLLTDVTATVKVYKNISAGYTSPIQGTLAGTWTTHYTRDGFYTFDIPDTVSVEPGEIFSVIITLVDSGGCNIKIPVERNNVSEFTFTGAEKQSYMKNGSKYYDLYATYSAYYITGVYMHTYTTCTHLSEQKTEGTQYVTYCSRCGKEFGRSCITHSLENITTLLDPTCTQEGMNLGTCAYCGEQELVYTPATGHSYQAPVECENTQDNTTTYVRTCSACGNQLTSSTQIRGSTTITFDTLIRLIFERLFALFFHR